ncbi:MAG: hypothetical protein QNK37_37390 [Acidobacteriota bacterium]|nr:hypothetical protein [Acidobacteriota bacterium]
MNEPTPDRNAELAALQKEIARLSEELERLKQEPPAGDKEQTEEKTNKLFDELTAFLERSRNDGKKALEEVEKIGETIEKRPLLSVLIALLLGMLLGKLFGGSES